MILDTPAGMTVDHIDGDPDQQPAPMPGDNEVSLLCATERARRPSLGFRAEPRPARARKGKDVITDLHSVKRRMATESAPASAGPGKRDVLQVHPRGK
jgi:hypothetical protein